MDPTPLAEIISRMFLAAKYGRTAVTPRPVETTVDGRLKWTKTPPKVDGWYWWRRYPETMATMRLIEQGCVYKGAPVNEGVSAEKIGGEWAGPIAEPMESP